MADIGVIDRLELLTIELKYASVDTARELKKIRRLPEVEINEVMYSFNIAEAMLYSAIAKARHAITHKRTSLVRKFPHTRIASGK